MNSKKGLWILVGAILVAGGYYGYKKFFGMTKEKAIQIIKKIRGDKFDAELAKEMDTQYLIARAKALQKNEKTFEYEGKTYDTEFGKAVK